MTESQMRKLRDDLSQIIADKESWNDNRPEHPPFDVGADKAMLQYVTKMLACWGANDINGVNRWNAKLQELSRAIDEQETPTDV